MDAADECLLVGRGEEGEEGDEEAGVEDGVSGQEEECGESDGEVDDGL